MAAATLVSSGMAGPACAITSWTGPGSPPSRRTWSKRTGSWSWRTRASATTLGAGHPQYCRAVGFAAAIDSREEAQEDARAAGRRRTLLESAGIEGDPVAFAPDTWFHFRRFFLREGMLTESWMVDPWRPSWGGSPAGWTTIAGS